MKSDNYRFTSSELPIIANHFLNNYRRDRTYFEHYSSKFDDNFLDSFEEKVYTLAHLTPVQTIDNHIAKLDEIILNLIGQFHPILNITKAFLRCVPKISNLPMTRFCLTEFELSLNRKCIWEIQRSCMKLIGELEREN